VLQLGLRFRSSGFWPLECWRGAGPSQRASRFRAVTVNCHGLGACQSLAYESGAVLTHDCERSIVPSDQLANSVVQNRGGFQCDTQCVLKLADCDPPSGEGNKVDRLKPEMQLEMAGFENSADLDRERLAAPIALVRPAPGAFAPQLADPSPRAPATRTYGTGRPKPRLAEGIRRLLVVEVGRGMQVVHPQTNITLGTPSETRFEEIGGLHRAGGA
jgi:hypothetical protein